MAALADGRPVDALADAAATTPILEPTGLTTSLVESAVLTARAALWVGDADRLGRAIDEIRAFGAHGRWLAAMLATLTAGYEARTGGGEGAVERYATATAAWRQIGAPLQLALCQLEAALLLPSGSPEAVDAAAEAREILGGLGARALLDRLEHGLATATRAEPEQAGALSR